MKNFKQSIKFWWQRRTRGFDDSETWSLDHSLAKLILPRLRRFKEITKSSDKQMNNDLDLMIASFEFAASDKRWMADHDEYAHHQLGIDLFASNFFGLWW